MFATLYTSAFALGQIFFTAIDRAFPDVTNPQSTSQFRDSLRWALANLIVAFPIFAGLAVSTQRAIARDPARRASRVRKWLTYLTLFLGAAAIIHGRFELFGATTGASIWVVGAIGMACGFGFYMLAVAVTAAGLFVLTVLGLITGRGRPEPDDRPVSHHDESQGSND